MKSRAILLRTASCLLAGGLAGLAVLALDQLLAVATLGCAFPLSWRLGVAYPATGILFALVIQGALAWRGVRWDAGRLAAAAAAAIYAPAIFERIHSHGPTILVRLAGLTPALGWLLQPAPLAILRIAGALAAVCLFGLWIALLARVAGPLSLSAALGLGALTAAVALAANRHLLASPTSPASLAADAMMVIGSLGAAWLIRAAGPRRALAACAVLLTVLLPSGRWWHDGTSTGPTTVQRPHLILVVADTLRLDVFDAVVRETEEGRAFADALGGAAWFTQAVTTAPWTLPSVSSILTGLLPEEHGFTAHGVWTEGKLTYDYRPMRQSVSTLAEHLARRGYRTAALNANYLLNQATGPARGFEDYEVLFGAPANLPLPMALVKLGVFPPWTKPRAVEVRLELRKRLGEIARSRRPLFLWLHLMDTHDPFQSHWGLSRDGAAQGLPELERLYRGEVRYLLGELAGVFDLLRAYGLWDSAAVVVVSDHGEMFPSDEHDIGVPAPSEDWLYDQGHGHALYDELMRVPLVIRPPGGLPAGRRIDALTSLVDLHDTLLDLLEVDAPRIGGERVSLAPWLAPAPAASPPRRREAARIGSNSRGPRQRGLRTATQKLIEYMDGEWPPELYDVGADPREKRDLAALEPERLAAAARRFESLWPRLEESPEAPAVEADPETLERLRALGYVR